MQIKRDKNIHDEIQHLYIRYICDKINIKLTKLKFKLIKYIKFQLQEFIAQIEIISALTNFN